MTTSSKKLETSNKILEEILWQLEHSSSNTFAFFHLPLPHWPYVFNPDGTYFGSEGDDYRGPGDEAGYTRHLKYLDKIIGKIVTTLKESGKFDNSMIIFTSDHASKAETPFPELRAHVPLIIKLPEQENAYVIDKQIQNNQLLPIIDSVMRGNRDEAKIYGLISDAK